MFHPDDPSTAHRQLVQASTGVSPVQMAKAFVSMRP